MFRVQDLALLLSVLLLSSENDTLVGSETLIVKDNLTLRGCSPLQIRSLRCVARRSVYVDEIYVANLKDNKGSSWFPQEDDDRNEQSPIHMHDPRMFLKTMRKLYLDRSGHRLFVPKGLARERLGWCRGREDKVIGLVLVREERKGVKGSRSGRLREGMMPALPDLT